MADILKEAVEMFLADVEKDFPGLMDGIYNSVDTNISDIIYHTNSVVNENIYALNDEFYEGYQWIACLDSRTCLECASLDSKIFQYLPNDDERYGTAPRSTNPLIIPMAPPELPLHRNCRCILTPVLEGMAEEMKAGPNYHDWFEKQSNDRKLDILGPSRYAAYKEGKAVTQFVKDGKILTLEQLKIDRVERKQIRTTLTNIDNINPVTVALADDFKTENKALERRLKEMQNSAVNLFQNKSGERDITITDDGGIVTKWESQTPGKIVLPVELMDKMKQYRERSLTSIHTHTSGGFSKADIYSAYSNENIREMIAMCATGEVYEIDVSSGMMPTEEEFKEMYEKIFKLVSKNYNLDSKTGMMYAINKTNRKIAEKYGWRYSEGWLK